MISQNLKLGNKYTKIDLSKIFDEKNVEYIQQGYFRVKKSNTALLFVTLDKTGQPESLKYNDYFENDWFHWDSMKHQHINHKDILKMVNGDDKIYLFARIHSKIKSQTSPWIYSGELKYNEYDSKTEKPVHIIFLSEDYDDFTDNEDLLNIYLFHPKLKTVNSSNTINKLGVQSERRKSLSVPNLKVLNKPVEVETRTEQEWFKRSQRRIWDNKCALTKCSVLNVLQAAHIVPRNKCTDDEKLDDANGILLSATIHLLFEYYLISFDDKGKILISKNVSSDDKKILGISSDMNVRVYKKMIKYLKRHREEFYKINT